MDGTHGQEELLTPSQDSGDLKKKMIKITEKALKLKY